MVNELWLERAEISPSTLEKLGKLSEKEALVLFVKDQRLASIVLQPLPLQDKKNEIARVHPVLYDFFCCFLDLVDKQPKAQIQKFSVAGCFRVSLEALPIGPPHSVSMTHFKTHAIWSLCKVPVAALPEDSSVHLSIIFWDLSFSKYVSTIPRDLQNVMLKALLLGRIVKIGSVVLLSAEYGYAICVIRNLPAAQLQLESNTAYRIPMNTNGWTLLVQLPETKLYSQSSLDSLNSPMYSLETTQEADCSGYDSVLQETLRLVKFGANETAPSGILLTGMSGVGKSHLLCSIIQSYTEQAVTEHRSSEIVYYVTVQDLLHQAKTESRLLDKVIIPRLHDAKLWILDDLHLLESSLTENLYTTDATRLIVENSILQAIDLFKSSVVVVGICREASKLPHHITKVGRLEKEIEMLPPDQIQRKAIWKSLLQSQAKDSFELERWALALSNVTSGCVAGDLVRILDDANKRRIGRSSEVEDIKALEWEDLREAARQSTPLHVAELDVRKPVTFSPSLSWKDLHDRSWRSLCGYRGVKNEVFRQIVVPWRHFLRQADSFESIAAEKWPSPPSGVLFHGEPGCGKTLSAECLASSLQLPIIQIRATDILDKWLGGSEHLLRSTFARARAFSPCILFVDEVDAIANNRQHGISNDFTSRILSTFLNEMDGVASSTKKSKVLVVACTNRLDSLDAALLRPGRLQEHIFLTLPSEEDLLDILRHYLALVPLADDVSIERLAKILAALKFGGAHAEGFCREVCLGALRDTRSIEGFMLRWCHFVSILRRFDSTRLKTLDLSID